MVAYLTFPGVYDISTKVRSLGLVSFPVRSGLTAHEPKERQGATPISPRNQKLHDTSDPCLCRSLAIEQIFLTLNSIWPRDNKQAARFFLSCRGRAASGELRCAARFGMCHIVSPPWRFSSL